MHKSKCACEACAERSERDHLMIFCLLVLAMVVTTVAVKVYTAQPINKPEATNVAAD